MPTTKTKSVKLTIRRTPDAKRVVRVPGRSGHGFFEFLEALFILNEKLPKTQKMTDTEISRQLVEEFPNSTTAQRMAAREVNSTVNKYRTYYNRGRFHKVTGEPLTPPAVQSHRYTEDGEVANPQTGKPLSLYPHRLNNGEQQKELTNGSGGTTKGTSGKAAHHKRANRGATRLSGNAPRKSKAGSRVHRDRPKRKSASSA